MSSAATTTIITVVGMTCDHCVRAVREELAKVDGVRSVDIDLPSGRVTVHSDGPVGDAAVAHAVEEAGYEVSG